MKTKKETKEKTYTVKIPVYGEVVYTVTATSKRLAEEKGVDLFIGDYKPTVDFVEIDPDCQIWVKEVKPCVVEKKEDDLFTKAREHVITEHGGTLKKLED